MKNEFNFVGEIKTPYTDITQCPRNISADGPTCTITIYPEFTKECFGLVKKQKIMVLYWLDSEEKHKAKRPADCPQLLGAFSLRTPHRPNPIGVAVLDIVMVDVKKGIIMVNGLDCLNGTRVIDIKPAIMQEKTL